MFMSVHKGGGGCKNCPKSCSRSLWTPPYAILFTTYRSRDFFTSFYYFSGRIKHINQSKTRRFLDFRVAFFNKFSSTFIFINGGTFFVMNSAEKIQKKKNHFLQKNSIKTFLCINGETFLSWMVLKKKYKYVHYDDYGLNLWTNPSFNRNFKSHFEFFPSPKSGRNIYKGKQILVNVALILGCQISTI